MTSAASWSTVSLSDWSAVTLVGKWVGNWSADATSSFHNVSNPSTPASVSFTFHGTQARAVGFMTYHGFPLSGSITRDSSVASLVEPFSYNQCIDDDASPPCASSAFYTTDRLPCNKYTLDLSVQQHQAMHLKEFGFIPCTSDDTNNFDDQTSALGTVSTTAYATAPSPSRTIAAEKLHLSTGMIVGVVLGALAFFALTSLALFIFLRRGRRIARPSPSLSPSPSPSSSPSSFFSSSSPWLRLAGPQPGPLPNTSSAQSLAPVSSPSLAVAAASRHARCSTTSFDAPAGTSTSAAPAAQASVPSTTGLAAPTLPWLFERSAGYYPSPRDEQRQHVNRDGEWGEIVEKQPVRPDNDAEMDTGGLAIARGYLPDSKELIAWGEAADPRTPRTNATEALPQYQTRGSLQWSS